MGRALVLACAAVVLAAAPVWAHHAFAAEFDSKRPIELKGTVTKVELDPAIDPTLFDT